MDKLRRSRHHDSTKKNYGGIWRIFNEFFIRLDVKPMAWCDRLNLFVAHLINENKKSSTVRSYISAIKAILADGDIELKEDMYLLSSLIKACRLHNDRVTLRFPIQKLVLELSLKTTREHYMTRRQIYNCHLILALFSTVYYGLFRVGELTNSQHVVKACDVHLGINKCKMLFILRTSKTHSKGSPLQIIKIMSSGPFTSSQFCPYKLLNNYLNSRKGFVTEQEQFFVFRDRSCIDPSFFRKTLKHMLNLSGFDNTYYSCHSFRSGRPLDLLQLGLSVETIKKLGRWKSNAVYVYLR